MSIKQLQFNLSKGSHGGRRPGAGRKRIHSKGVAHRKREKVSHSTPLHINFKYKCSIRNKFCLRLLKRAILNARRKGLGVVHFSLQHNHVHLIVEVRDLKVLERGMRSLTVTMAKGMRKGKVQLKRYHLHVLRTIRETKNALHYVLFNDQRHGGKKVGEFSSVFTHPKVIEMIKSFCRNKSLTLFIERSQDFEELTNARSFLLLTSSV